ncbi:MAG: DUF4835 family protein [Ignavibacteriaceae bacterium]|jgi:uncharacterized protein YmfQ (DUF2313 family)|nr:DUF4835 family protein [Ignavibacteriaceae bacterium]
MRYLIFVFLFPVTLTFSQELRCKVTVNYEGLAVISRERLVDFANIIESYMNNNQFTSDSWDGEKIDCSLSIFFTNVANETDYSAQVVIVSTRPVYKSTRQSSMLTISDANWSFRYLPNQALYANQATFDPLTSFLDFYANIIIGFDWETWKELGGSSYFTKAFDIINLSVSSPFKKGWEQSSASYSKWGLCNDLLNDRYRQFREAFYEYHYGVDEYQINKKDAQAKIINMINVLEDMQKKVGIANSVLIKQFFDTKYGEFVELLRDYPDSSVFARLKKIDPSHATKYDEALK